MTDIAKIVSAVNDHAGDYRPGSILAGLNLFDQFRWHLWFDDFVAGPSYHGTDVAASWKILPDHGNWTGLSSRATVGMVERNMTPAVATAPGTWLQIADGALSTDYFHLSAPDAAGSTPGATYIPLGSAGKKYVVACKVAFSETSTKYGIGATEIDIDPNTILDATTSPPGIYILTVGGVATVHIRNYEYSTPKTAVLPTTITYNPAHAYEFELLNNGAGTFMGQYRVYTNSTGVPGAWVSLGSVSLSGWQLFPSSIRGGPWMGLKNTTAVASELDVDYLLIAAER